MIWRNLQQFELFTMQKNILFQDAKMAGFCPTNLTIVGIFAMQETLTSKMLA